MSTLKVEKLQHPNSLNPSVTFREDGTIDLSQAGVSLGDIADIDVSSAQWGSILIYDDTTHKWISSLPDSVEGTVDPEPETLMQRDSQGRTKVADPEDEEDAANKSWVTEQVNALGEAVASAGVPPGAIQTFAMDSAPDGWLKANGAEVSRETYADLFVAIGTTYGNGDGSTTFELPDLRGEFLRYWDDGRGVDSGRVLGSSQGHAFGSHSHTQNYTNRIRRLSHDGSTSPPISVSVPLSGTNAPISGQGGGDGLELRNATASTSSSGGAETRPRNVALLACIKY